MNAPESPASTPAGLRDATRLDPRPGTRRHRAGHRDSNAHEPGDADRDRTGALTTLPGVTTLPAATSIPGISISSLVIPLSRGRSGRAGVQAATFRAAASALTTSPLAAPLAPGTAQLGDRASATPAGVAPTATFMA